MPGEIPTLPEVAKLLKVAEKTVYTTAQKSEPPAFEVRGQWRFKRADIDAWIEQQKAAAAATDERPRLRRGWGMAGEVMVLADRGWLYHPEHPDRCNRCWLYSMAKWVNGPSTALPEAARR